MLQILLLDPSTNKQSEIRWYVGEVFPHVNILHIQELEATGQEHAFIKENFINVPITKELFCSWRTYFAIFIVENLNVYCGSASYLSIVESRRVLASVKPEQFDTQKKEPEGVEKFFGTFTSDCDESDAGSSEDGG